MVIKKIAKKKIVGCTKGAGVKKIPEKSSRCARKTERNKKIKRVPTGIVNLDKIIEGGLEKNSTI